jgi:hypothetical protein
VEVDEQAQARDRRALADLDGPVDVHGPAAIAVAVGVEGVVPHAHAHIGDARIGEHVEEVRRRSGGIAEDDARVLQRDHRRHVDAVDEVLRQILDLVHDDPGLHGSVVRHGGRRSRHTEQGGQDEHCDR